MSVLLTSSTRSNFSSPPQQGHRTTVTGTGSGGGVEGLLHGAERRRKVPCPGFRPGRLGLSFFFRLVF